MPQAAPCSRCLKRHTSAGLDFGLASDQSCQDEWCGATVLAVAAVTSFGTRHGMRRSVSFEHPTYHLCLCHRPTRFPPASSPRLAARSPAASSQHVRSCRISSASTSSAAARCPAVGSGKVKMLAWEKLDADAAVQEQRSSTATVETWRISLLSIR